MFNSIEIDITECTICIEQCLSNLSVLSCGHVYHKVCIDNWLE